MFQSFLLKTTRSFSFGEEQDTEKIIEFSL